ncbi:MAG TPA: hypothetical protein VM344_07735, partial [Vitreimonas sp.]|nr:hypothetical protein [Vitreimonas sp.]
MTTYRIVDVTDESSFALVPPCADPGFDHRSCDYWEDADRGSKAARLSWLESRPAGPPSRPRTGNPFLDEADEPEFNPFVPGPSGPPLNPFLDEDEPINNPFAPPPKARPTVGSQAPRKLALLGRGLGVFGSY